MAEDKRMETAGVMTGDAQEAVKTGESTLQEQIPEEQERKFITIKFSRKLCSEPFQSKKGHSFVEIKIPNLNPDDHSAWQHFILPEKSVRENKFGNGLWARIPEDGTTTLRRDIRVGEKDGRSLWETQDEVVTNLELKARVEAYKTRNQERPVEQSRDSVLQKLAARKQDIQESERPVEMKAKAAEAVI